MKVKVLLATIVLGTGCAAALASDIPNKDVADAVKSLIDGERSVYTKLIEQRAKVHGCVIAKDVATLKANEATIPNVADFQGIVANAVKTLDGGAYAQGIDVNTLASKPGGMSPQATSDLLHAYADTSRTNYTASVVARARKSGCSKTLEEWSEENGLPLPAQFTRATAEAVRKAGKFSYSLQSEWPINKQNAPKTNFEKQGTKAVQNRKPFYGEEVLAGKKYFSAVYADIASNDACTSCHNSHAKSPRKDFKLQDVMGNMVVRIPMK